MSETLPFSTRLWFAFVCAFRILADGLFGARVWAVRDGMPVLAEAKPAKPDAPKLADIEPKLRSPREPSEVATEGQGVGNGAALQVLAALQREGRLLDFLEEDIQGFSDADIGAVVREVHAGCRKVLREHAPLEPVRSESEGSSVTLEAGFDAAQIKLTGDVKGAGPYRGTLRHRGWRVRELKLPTLLVMGNATDSYIVAPAEVEL